MRCRAVFSPSALFHVAVQGSSRTQVASSITDGRMINILRYPRRMFAYANYLTNYLQLLLRVEVEKSQHPQYLMVAHSRGERHFDHE